MKALDTCILARLILADDQAQHRSAIATLAEPVWITYTVWLELGWVLGRKLKLDRVLVADALLALLAIETVRTDAVELLRWAIGRYRAGADWGDMMHLVQSAGLAGSFVTFDASLGDQAGQATPLRIERLA